MKTNRLGSSGFKISRIIYGNWLTHGSQIEQDMATTCVKQALDLGITSFDTADVYAMTKAEEVLGNALKGQRRENLEIFTKVFWPTGPGANDRGLSRKHIVESCNNSLKRLGIDYIDLYQAHRYDYETPIEETVEAFDYLVSSGKVLYLGVSEWRVEEIAGFLAVADSKLKTRLVSNQPQYSILWRVIEEEILPYSIAEGIGQIVWSPLAQGVLTGKYKVGQDPPKDSRATDPTGSNFLSGFLRKEVLEAVEKLEPIAKDCDATMAQLSLAWVLNHEGISGAIVGATRPEQLVENVKAIDIKITDEVMKRIDEAVKDVVISDPSRTMSPKTRP
jgi:aryl-alcohol dehydrogenase-like predicted oxidoreductase